MTRTNSKNQTDLGVREEFLALVRATGAMSQMLGSLDEAPIQLLGRICREYGKSGMPVPDYHLPPLGYIGEVCVKALVSAKLIESQPGPKVSLFRYQPTEEGMRYYQRLVVAGLLQK